MIAGTKYSKLIRFGMIFIPILLVMVGVYIWFYPPNTLDLKVDCEGVEVTQRYCLFTCNVSSNLNVTGRLTVTHTVWASIFEKRMDIEANKIKTVEFKIPRRRYFYLLRGGFYEEKTGFIQNYDAMGGDLYC